MKYTFVTIQLFACSLFAAQKSPYLKPTLDLASLPFASFAHYSQQSDSTGAVSLDISPENTKAVIIPNECIIFKHQLHAAWCKVLGHAETDIAKYSEFEDQLARKEIILPTVKIRDSDKFSPCKHFIMLCMANVFCRDQYTQMYLRNFGRSIARPYPLEEFKSIKEFMHFQLREKGPKTLMLTAKARSDMVAFAIQDPSCAAMLTEISHHKNIDPVFTEKMQVLAREQKSAFESVL